MKSPAQGLIAAAAAFALVLLPGCSAPSPQPSTPAASGGDSITITDRGGRTVTIKKGADLAFGAGPPGSVMLQTFGGKYVAGWNNKVSEDSAKYLGAGAKDKPVLGRANGSDGTFNPETLLKMGVDVIIDAGDIIDKYVKADDDLQARTGIPVVMLSTDPDKIADGYRILGQIFNNPTRGEELAVATKNINEKISAKAKTIAEDKKVTVYSGAGDKGLSTAPKGSIHTRVIELVGAKNAADIPLKSTSGRTDIDFEQILKWQPNWVVLGVSGDGPLATNPKNDANFGQLDGVKSGKYLIPPTAPYGWFDGPPSVNQLIGTLWLAQSLYPDVYGLDLPAEVVSFYKTFYAYDMTLDEAKAMLKASNAVK